MASVSFRPEPLPGLPDLAWMRYTAEDRAGQHWIEVGYTDPLDDQHYALRERVADDAVGGQDMAAVDRLAMDLWRNRTHRLFPSEVREVYPRAEVSWVVHPRSS